MKREDIAAVMFETLNELLPMIDYAISTEDLCDDLEARAMARFAMARSLSFAVRDLDAADVDRVISLGRDLVRWMEKLEASNWRRHVAKA